MSEVKRWRMSDMHLSEYGLYTEVVLASEYDNLSAKLSTTNSNWPHEKGLHEIIATQTRVIEKLTEQRDGSIEAHYFGMGKDYLAKESIAKADAEIAAIK